MKSVSLFSGLGALDLAVAFAFDVEPVLMYETNDYCRSVLSRHWPNADLQEDANMATFYIDPTRASWVVGGFPCQNISDAGDRTGILGAKSSLWKCMKDVIDHVRPVGVVAENVGAIQRRGLDCVLDDLDALGYITAWAKVDCREVGLPLRRQRVFLLAVSDSIGCSGKSPPWLHVEREPRDYLDRRDVARVRMRASLEAPVGPEPGLRRGSDGPSRGMVARRRRDRLRALGNSVVPAQAVKGLKICASMIRKELGYDD